MGLAPYGEPKYADVIRRELFDLKPDGSFRLNLDYFNFLHGTTMTNEKFHALFGGPPRGPEEKIEQRHMDVARSIQVVTEEIMLRLARHAREVTGQKNLCLAGGVALNCVANGIILREKIFDNIWIQPAAGDAGGALGAALAAWHGAPENPREAAFPPMPCRHRCSARDFPTTKLKRCLRAHSAVFQKLEPSRAAGFHRRTFEDGKSHRLVSRPDGVRPARAGQPLDSRRRALDQNAVGDELEGEISRIVPALRAHRPARAGGGLF